MPRSLCLTGGDVVLPHSIARDCSILIEDDRITAIGANAAQSKQCQKISVNSKWILPGLIDLHSDEFQQLVAPRPNTFFPLPFTIRECDKRHLAAGITTVFHAIAFAGKEFGVRDPNIADQIIRALSTEPEIIQRRNHLRYEISDVSSASLVGQLIRENKVDLISFMDHSPGQGQNKRRGSYTRYLMKTYAITEREAHKLIAQKKQQLNSGSEQAVAGLLRLAKSAHIPIAGHDLDSPHAVVRWADAGADICEFPINMESAQASRDRKLPIVMGAPNIIRGTSSSGALRAMEAIRENLVDVLCSDYNSSCLLPALFKVASELNIPLHETVALATSNPAEIMGLHDVGKIEEGCLANLIIVDPAQQEPNIDAVMVSGQFRYSMGGY